MALGDQYVTTDELRDYCQIADSVDDQSLQRVARAVSNGVEEYCRRQFNDAGSASARVFYPASLNHVVVDDFSTITGLLVKTGDSFGTTLTNFTLEPLNGVEHGRPGFPFRKIRLYGSTFTTSTDRKPTVQVTARWGWTAVPDDVKQACLIKGAKVFKRRYSLDGVVGQGDFVFRVSRYEDPDVVDLLCDFKLPKIQFC
jgi:hypothetical protein